MQQTILTKTSRTGQQIEIKLKEYLPGQHIAQLFLDGQYVFGQSQPVPLAQPQADVTHWLGGSKGKVGLTAAEADLIFATIREANAATRTPTVIKSEAILPEEESALLSRSEGAKQPGAAQTWQGQASMDAEDSTF